MKPVKYTLDLGWPWTSDKAFSECKWCFKSPGVFGNSRAMFEEGTRPVHPWCFAEIMSTQDEHDPVKPKEE